MANKVIQIGSKQQTKSLESEEIYLDLSMESKQIKDKYRISKSVNVRAVQNSLDNIFRWIPGERILNPEFGTKLYHLLYEGITKYNEEQIVAEIKSSVSKWEPRVVIKDIENISTIDDTEDNTIVINIKYYIKGLPDTIFDKQYIYNRSN